MTSMSSTIAAILLVIIYLGTDRFFRRGAQARSFTADESDRKSTYFIGLAIGISLLTLLISPLLNYLRIGKLELGWFWGWLGVILALSGWLLRVWATKTLGRFYTRTLLTTSDHKIVQEGPYKLVRHPGYTGSLMVWIGAGWATANWIVFAIITLVCVASYLYRIRSEETMLLSKFGEEYAGYRQRTKRLIPYIY